MIGLHVPFTRMSFLNIKGLLLKWHRFPLTILSKEDMCTKPGKNFCIEYQWNTSGYMAGSLQNWTMMLCLQMQELHPTELFLNFCQRIDKYFSHQTLSQWNHVSVQNKNSRNQSKSFCWWGRREKKGVRTRPSYCILLILVRNKRVQSHAWVINNCCFWPRVKQTICLHCSHRRAHE